jgi:hypothetical protein
MSGRRKLLLHRDAEVGDVGRELRAACVTRICVRIRSVFGSVATSKFAVSRSEPSLPLIEYM